MSIFRFGKYFPVTETKVSLCKTIPSENKLGSSNWLFLSFPHDIMDTKIIEQNTELKFFKNISIVFKCFEF